MEECRHLLEEHVAPCHLVDSCERVLYNSHHRSVGLRRHYHTWHSGQLTDLGSCLQSLSQMQVHLIAIKVSVVWRRHTTYNNQLKPSTLRGIVN